MQVTCRRRRRRAKLVEEVTRRCFRRGALRNVDQLSADARIQKLSELMVPRAKAQRTSLMTVELGRPARQIVGELAWVSALHPQRGFPERFDREPRGPGRGRH